MPFREAIRQLAARMQTCEEWLELRRDLLEPIPERRLPDTLTMRWAGKDDLMAINALQGFVKTTDFMEASLKRGDRCLLLENGNGIQAFAWATFSDFRLATWYTLRLAPGESYLVYIFVHPSVARQGVGSALLGALMAAVRDGGGTHMLSGMYSDWLDSLGMHTKLGFRIHRRLTQCRLMGIFPTPPKLV